MDAALKLLSSINGGATAMPPVRGAWLNPESGKLVIEEPVLVYSYIDPDQFEARVSELVDLVHRMGRETRQGEMAIEFDGVLYRLIFGKVGGRHGAKNHGHQCDTASNRDGHADGAEGGPNGRGDGLGRARVGARQCGR